MTAAGRLWRRAPLWKLALASTAAFGVLTALYPAPAPSWLRVPGWVHVPPWLHLPHAASPATGPSAAATPAAAPGTPAAQPTGSLVATGTPTEPPLHTSLTVGGRVVPLPEGDWHELEAARGEEASEISWVVLGRWQGGALTGYLSVMATTGPADNGKQAGVVDACNSYENYSVKWSDTGHTCWLIRKTDIPPPGADAGTEPHTVNDAALARLRILGITIPAWLSTTIWSHADGSEIMNYELMVANGRNPHDQSAALATLQGWMGRFAPLLHAGFDGKLQLAAIRAVAHDPGSDTPRH